jgi:uncharacterized protein YndB with AHSA1/START domain
MNTVMIAETSIVIAANRERVWKAITQPSAINKWFNASATSDTERVMWKFDRLEAGAPMFFSWKGKDGKEQGQPGSIALVEPPQRFAFHWTPDPHHDLQSLVTFVLETVPEGTRLTITEQGFEGLPEEIRQNRYEMNAEGWRIQAKSIAAYMMEQ